MLATKVRIDIERQAVHPTSSLIFDIYASFLKMFTSSTSAKQSNFSES